MRLKIIIQLATFLLNFHQISSKNQKVLQIRRFQACSEYPNLAMMLIDNKKKTFTNYTHIVEMTFLLQKRIESNVEGKFNLWKCDLSGTPDSCEYYIKDLRMKQICKKMAMKNQVWTNFVEGFEPALQCPIKPGKYKVSFTLSHEVFKFFPVPRAVWKSKIFLYVDEEIITCLNSEVRVIERTLR